LLEQEVDMRAVQVLLGHGSVRSTMLYLHVSTARVPRWLVRSICCHRVRAAIIDLEGQLLSRLDEVRAMLATLVR
jgi:hypothetical protein